MVDSLKKDTETQGKNAEQENHRARFQTGLGFLPEDWWALHSSRGDWARGRYFQRFELERATPQMMDALWADGWRHFGTTFFRDYFNIHGSRLVRVLPLRIRLSQFSHARDQRRIMKQNKDLEVKFRPILITDEHMDLFKRHALRFTENRPPSLYSFLSLSPVLVPCPNLMCEIREEGRLVAASFFDVGKDATSSIYAMFDPDEASRGLGHYTLLSEIAYALHHGKTYVYTGYAHTISSYYDYKKRYRGTEFYDWKSKWHALSELRDDFFPTHRFEVSDIPPDLLEEEDPESTSDADVHVQSMKKDKTQKINADPNSTSDHSEETS